VLTINTRLHELRKTLTDPKISQEMLAQQAGISRQWYHRLETGKQAQIGYTTAKNLLQAINAERQTRGLEALTLDDLSLTIV